MRQWAHVFHRELPVKTNNICESFFRSLKKGIIPGRRKRLDAAMHYLFMYHESFFRNLESRCVVDEVCHKSAQEKTFAAGL